MQTDFIYLGNFCEQSYLIRLIKIFKIINYCSFSVQGEHK